MYQLKLWWLEKRGEQPRGTQTADIIDSIKRHQQQDKLRCQRLDKEWKEWINQVENGSAILKSVQDELQSEWEQVVAGNLNAEQVVGKVAGWVQRLEADLKGFEDLAKEVAGLPLLNHQFDVLKSAQYMGADGKTIVGMQDWPTLEEGVCWMGRLPDWDVASGIYSTDSEDDENKLLPPFVSEPVRGANVQIEACSKILNDVYKDLMADWAKVEAGLMVAKTLKAKVTSYRTEMTKVREYPDWGENPLLDVQGLAQVPEKTRYLSLMLENLEFGIFTVGFKYEDGEFVGLKQGLKDEECPFWPPESDGQYVKASERFSTLHSKTPASTSFLPGSTSGSQAGVRPISDTASVTTTNGSLVPSNAFTA